jgi:hypothetical protein
MVVDAIVRCWAAEVLEQEDAAIDGGQDEWVKVAPMCYADDGVLTSHDARLSQTSSDCLVHLFSRVGLNTNIKTNNSMVCLLGRVQDHISRSAYDRIMIDKSKTYQERKRRKFQCQTCDKTLTYASLSTHVVELSTNLHDSPEAFHYQESFPLYF